MAPFRLILNDFRPILNACLSLNTELVYILFMEWRVRKPNFTRLKSPLPLKKPHNSFQKVTLHCLMHPAWQIINRSSTEFYKSSRHYTNSACQLRALRRVFSNADHMQWWRTKQRSLSSTWFLILSQSISKLFNLGDSQKTPTFCTFHTLFQRAMPKGKFLIEFTLPLSLPGFTNTSSIHCQKLPSPTLAWHHPAKAPCMDSGWAC